jgi:sialate O-acetylesterase
VAEYRGDRLYVFGWRGERFYERPPLPFDFSGYSPTALFNGMIAPLVPFSLAGVIWYQGESNASAPLLYRTLFPLMIGNWRSAFHTEGLPFYFVQIAPYEYGPATQSAYLREAQFLSLRAKNTGMAVTLDIGSARTIHPPNKQEVGRRLALLALAKAYGKKIVSSGPLYRSMKTVGDRIELLFGNVAGGLVLTQSERGNGFQVAGEDRIFRNADVAVRGSRLIVSSPLVKRPVAVRYAFGNVWQATLYNIEGLPSSSFRTDDWNP